MATDKDVFCDLVLQGKILADATGTDAHIVSKLKAIYDKTSNEAQELEALKKRLHELQGSLAASSHTGIACASILFDAHGERYAAEIADAQRVIAQGGDVPPAESPVKKKRKR